MNGKILIFLCLAIGLAGCTVPVRIRPLDRPMPSSETSGRPFKPSLGGRIGARPTIELTSDLRNSAPTPSSPSLSQSEDVSLFADIALAPRLDVGLDLSLYQLILRGKFQIFGNPVQTTRAGNLSLAVTTGLGVGTTGNDDKNTATTYSSTHQSQHSYSVDAALVAGVRPAEWLLTYLGVSAKYLDYNGSFTSSNASVGTGDFKGQTVWWGPYTGLELSSRRFRYRMSFGWSPLKSGEVQENLFSSQGELSVALGSIED